jgi:hypothetical protein
LNNVTPDSLNKMTLFEFILANFISIIPIFFSFIGYESLSKHGINSIWTAGACGGLGGLIWVFNQRKNFKILREDLPKSQKIFSIIIYALLFSVIAFILGMGVAQIMEISI